MITHERLCELLVYLPESGNFVRLTTRGGRHCGSIAGHRKKKDGYWVVAIDGKHYPAARLAWFYMTGAWPVEQIDHRDLDPSNNVWSNLRAATRSENNRNKRIYRTNKTGFKGVFCEKKKGKYRAQIQIDNKRISLGTFSTALAAAQVREAALRPIHGEFTRQS